MTSPDSLKAINDFRSLVAYLRDELEWEIPEDLSYDQLTYSYTADELGLKLDAQVEITQLRPILGQQNPWGVFFVDFDKAELPVTLLRRILSSLSRRKRESANAGDRALFDKNDLLFVSAFGKADERRLALAHFHQELATAALPTLRVLTWDRHDTQRHMDTVVERLARLRWPGRGELSEAWKVRWSNAFIDRPRAAISTSKDMAAALAACAKQIREAIQEILPKEQPGQPLSLLFEAVKATLDKDLNAARFADTYAQTIAYGLLSKRIDQIQRWRAEKKRNLNGDLPLPMITVDALETAIPTNPFLSELLNSFLTAGGRDHAGAKLDFDELGLGDVVDLLNTANMAAVLDDFDKDKQGDDPVIHFYEGFLAAYDKAMKVQRGVFYTPKPVVSFIVRSVDEVLRTELGLPLGLADTTTWAQFIAAHPEATMPDGVKADDPFVKILDPATGTGTFLVEVIDLIHRRMMEEAWKEETVAEKRRLWNAYVARDLLPRLYGYELMMAPYAVAHMKIGLKLGDTGYDFSGTETGSDDQARPTRARVFLTNSLEPPHDFASALSFMNAALAHEAHAANSAKISGRYTVIIGNPPYSGISSNNNSWIDNLLHGRGEDASKANYYELNGKPLGEKKLWIQDDYVKFIRLSQLILDKSDFGVSGLITNHGYCENPTFRGLRKALIDSFNVVRVWDLHGNSRKKETAPGGGADENVFDIEQGVAIGIFAKTPAGRAAAIKFGDVWGDRPSKMRHLAAGVALQPIVPASPFYLFSQRVFDNAGEYNGYAKIDEIMPSRTVGAVCARDHLVIGFDGSELLDRIRDFATLPVEAARSKYSLGSDARDWRVETAQADAKASGCSSKYLKSITYRPFDVRKTYYTGRSRGLYASPCAATMSNMVDIQNIGLITARSTETPGEWNHAFCATDIIQHHSVSSKEVNYLLPLWISGGALDQDTRANFTPGFTRRASELCGLPYRESGDTAGPATLQERLAAPLVDLGPEALFCWIYAVLHAPGFRTRYAAFLKSDFARIPLPGGRNVFADLASLGAQLIALHTFDSAAAPELFDPKIRFVNVGHGAPRLGAWGEKKDVRRDPVSGRVYINRDCFFKDVPERAWSHRIGGYEPAQKWLKDRSQTGSNDKLNPGRLLTDEDILHYRRMIVALEETGKVMTEIDEVIARHGGWPGAFRGMES